MYSNTFPSNAGNNVTFQQVIDWYKYVSSERFGVPETLIHGCSCMGRNAFCIRLCFGTPAKPELQYLLMFVSKPPPYRGLGCVVISGVHKHDHPMHISNRTYSQDSLLHEPSRRRPMAYGKPVSIS